MPQFILVQTSIDSEREAQQIADTIIQQKLAACCWVIPLQSTYWWKGNVVKAQEWTLQFKTRADLYSELETTIKRLHSYETPEIVATSIIAGYQPFLDWIKDETKE